MTILSDQKTGVTPETAERAEIIAGIRALADLLEQVPQLPVSNYLTWAFSGRDDEAIPAYEAAVEALSSADVEHEYTADVGGHSRGINMRLHGLKFDLSHVHDKPWADYNARRSYDQVVQVDADQASAVSA